MLPSKSQNDQKLTQQRAVIKQKIVRDVIYIVAVLDHILGVEGYDEMEDTAKQERNIEGDKNEQNLVHHGCSVTTLGI